MKQYFRFIHTADWHLWDKHKYSVNNSRLKKIIRNIKFIIKFAIKKKVDAVFVAGDLTHVYNPDEKVLNQLTKIFKYAIDNGIKLRIINGNHDTDGLNHSLESLQNIISSLDTDMIKIFTFKKDQQAISYREFFSKQLGEGVANILHVSVTYVPYQDDMAHTISSAKEVACFNNFDRNIIVSHCAVDGAYASSGKKLKSNITLKHFEGWDYAALGDYHKYQKLSESVYYSGSAIRLNKGERNDIKGFNYVVISKEEKQKSKMVIKKINLSDIEMIELKLDYSKLKDNYGVIRKIKNKLVKDSIINLSIIGSIGTGDKLIKLKKALYAGGATEIYDKIININYNANEINNKLDLSLDISEATEKYAKRKNKNEKYIEYGKNKINSVR
jgi:DNA repair exonuclease SbcCD nuclease subunit